MSKETFLHMQHSESVIAQMAATLYTGLAQGRTLSEPEEDALVEKAATLAIKLAARTDALVKSDEEWVKRDKGSPYMIG